MLQLDINKFRKQLLESTARSFAEAQRVCKVGHIYGFSLMLDRFGSAVSGIAQSEEGLQESLSKESGSWISTTGNLAELVEKTKKWTCEDWHTFEPLFESANRLLNESYISNPKEFMGGGTTRLVFLCCLEILAELDVRGIFGKGKQREVIVLNLNVGDQSDQDLLRWAEQINPYEVYTRYSAEIQEARAAFKKLAYTGPP